MGWRGFSGPPRRYKAAVWFLLETPWGLVRGFVRGLFADKGVCRRPQGVRVFLQVVSILVLRPRAAATRLRILNNYAAKPARA